MDRWFSLGTMVFSTNKTNSCDITDLLLKLALTTIGPTNQLLFLFNRVLDICWKNNFVFDVKLRTYRKFKFIFRYETYISDIRNISHRNILTRFHTSNHKLHIETGRYTRPITPVENRICSNCNSKSVEDEIHFLMYCPKFENLRRELFSNVLNYSAAILSAEDKFVWILSNEDPSCVRELAKCIHSWFQNGACGY
jgi:hypothetical protein